MYDCKCPFDQVQVLLYSIVLILFCYTESLRNTHLVPVEKVTNNGFKKN